MITEFRQNNDLAHQQQQTLMQMQPSQDLLTPEQLERVQRAERVLSSQHPAVVMAERVNEVVKALVDQSEPAVTLPGRIVDKIYRFVGSFFKPSPRKLLAEEQDSPLAQEPSEVPADINQTPEITPQQENPPVNPQTPLNADQGYRFCASRLFYYDVGAGGVSLQVKVPDTLDCECASLNAFNRAQMTLIYISDFVPTSIREVRVTNENITAIFTADSYISKPFNNAILDKMPAVLTYVADECTFEKFRITRIILGTTLSFGGLLFIGGIALYYQREHMKRCCRTKCQP